MYFARFWALWRNETGRESCILRFLSASKQCNRAWITYFAGFWALRGNETERESRILQAFERFEAEQQSVNHVFCRVLNASSQWNRAWIMYFASFWTLRSNEAERESRILHGFGLFQALKHSVNHVFCKVLSASKHWNTAGITYFTRF